MTETKLPMTKRDRERVQRRLYTKYKALAKRRRKAFTLSYDEFIHLSFSECAYCGSAPSNTIEYSGFRLSYIGIDRIDGKKGYESGNVLPCCSFCNGLRGTMKFELWADFLNSVSSWNGGTEPFPDVSIQEGRENKRFYKPW